MFNGAVLRTIGTQKELPSQEAGCSSGEVSTGAPAEKKAQLLKYTHVTNFHT